jgi:hypothetical protein
MGIFDVQTISPARARRIALAAQGLDGSWDHMAGAEGAAATVERLGYVQIDTIAVIERAHEHALWVRQGSYQPWMLHQLLAVDRRVFEYWTHAASYVPMCDYRYYLRRMHANRSRDGTRAWMEANAKLVGHVRDRIRADGALAAVDFESGGRRGPWWDWKPAKRALECLFNIGELMISERRKFQRVYDLAERVLPATVDTRIPESDEAARWAVRWTLGNLGVAGFSQNRYWPVAGDSKAAVEELVESGEVVPVQLKGSGNGALYTLATTLEATAKTRRSRRVHLLSPFDNLVIRRDWLSQFFGFDYTLECYVPARKRRYGYFCLPILWGDRFVGRLDPKAERKKRVFAIRRLHFEPEVEAWDALLAPLARKTVELARFNGCDRVRLYSVRPAAIRMPLRRALDDALREA